MAIELSELSKNVGQISFTGSIGEPNTMYSTEIFSHAFLLPADYNIAS